VCLDRFNADVQIVRNLFVESASHNAVQYLFFPWGQAG